MDRRIFHIKEKISQSLGHSWSVDEMAELIGWSVAHFQRTFKEQLGTTPMAYLNDLRLEKAREMLADPECFFQIKQIGILVGHSNDSHFTRDFKKKIGMTPTEYRDHLWETHQSDPPAGQ